LENIPFIEANIANMLIDPTVISTCDMRAGFIVCPNKNVKLNKPNTMNKGPVIGAKIQKFSKKSLQKILTKDTFTSNKKSIKKSKVIVKKLT